MNNNIQIQLTWDDPTTGERREPRLSTPIAFGRDFSALPTEIGGLRVTRMLFNSDQVSRFHALIDWEQNQLVVTDQKSTNRTFVNGQPQTRSVLANGDSLQIGPYIITITFASASTPASGPSVNSTNELRTSGYA